MDERAGAGTGTASVQPVFVDEGGRRSRRARWVGRLSGLALVLYLVLLLASMARAPWVPHVGLPGLGPVRPPGLAALPPALPQARATPTPDLSARPLVPPARSTGTVAPGATAGTPGGGAPTSARGSGAPAGPAATATSAGGPATTTPPTTATTGRGASSTAPGRSTTTAAPGTSSGASTTTSAPTTTTSSPGRGATTTTNPHRR